MDQVNKRNKNAQIYNRGSTIMIHSSDKIPHRLGLELSGKEMLKE